MTVWHHKGELLKVSEGVATYRFFPDHVETPEASGVFRLNLTTFEAEITEPANSGSIGSVSNDEHCVSALVHKIRRAVTDSGAVPDIAFFVA